PNPQHGPPDPGVISLRGDAQPLAVQLLEPDCRWQIGRFADSALRFVILSPFRPLELLLACGRKFRRCHRGSRETILDAFADRHHCLTREYPASEQRELRRFGEEPDPELAPGVANELEHVVLLG